MVITQTQEVSSSFFPEKIIAADHPFVAAAHRAGALAMTVLSTLRDALAGLFNLAMAPIRFFQEHNGPARLQAQLEAAVAQLHLYGTAAVTAATPAIEGIREQASNAAALIATAAVSARDTMSTQVDKARVAIADFASQIQGPRAETAAG